MTGLNSQTPIPSELKLHQKSRLLEVAYADGSRYELSYELLRVLTPSAEARGHGPGEDTLQVGQRGVDITAIEPIGHYAIKPTFSDGHNTGIYSWDLLHTLCVKRDELWAAYLAKLDESGESREPKETSESPKKPPPACFVRRKESAD